MALPDFKKYKYIMFVDASGDDGYKFKNTSDLIFRDSKDKNFPLIQIADIFAGTIRTYNENCLPLKAHNKYCKICFSSSRSKA